MRLFRTLLSHFSICHKDLCILIFMAVRNAWLAELLPHPCPTASELADIYEPMNIMREHIRRKITGMVSEDDIAMNQNSNNVGASSSSAAMNRDDSEDSNDNKSADFIDESELESARKIIQETMDGVDSDDGDWRSPQKKPKYIQQSIPQTTAVNTSRH